MLNNRKSLEFRYDPTSILARDRLISLPNSVRLIDNQSILGRFSFKNSILEHLGKRISTIQSDPESNLGNKTCPLPFPLIYYNLIFSQKVFLTLYNFNPYNFIKHGQYAFAVRIFQSKNLQFSHVSKFNLTCPNPINLETCPRLKVTFPS